MKNKLQNIILLIIASMLLLACHGPKWMAKQEEKKKSTTLLYLQANPALLAEQCASKYPVKIDYKPGAPKIIHDTPWVDISKMVADIVSENLSGVSDSTKQAVLDSIAKHPHYIKVPVTNTSTTDTFFKENTAAIEEWRLKYNMQVDTSQHYKTMQQDTQSKYEDEKKQKRRWLWIVVAIGAYTVAKIVLKLSKPTSILTKFLP